MQDREQAVVKEIAPVSQIGFCPILLNIRDAFKIPQMLDL